MRQVQPQLTPPLLWETPEATTAANAVVQLQMGYLTLRHRCRRDLRRLPQVRVRADRGASQLKLEPGLKQALENRVSRDTVEAGAKPQTGAVESGPSRYF